MNNNFLIMGLPGSGKGTQATLLKEHFGIPHISTGEMFRWHITQKSVLGNEAQKHINEGNFVPDDITIAMVKERLLRDDCTKGFILDGFPRTLNQAQVLTALLEELHRPLRALLFLAISENEVFTRLKKRATLENRADDANPAIIAQRIVNYYNNTAPCVPFYQGEHFYKEIDGMGTIEEVFTRIKGVLT